ncbi:MAG: PilZ domain-containing protein [Candidatus Aminicenantes bacterium]|nr:PilZ domain-containing protein [Candidatus Aminicenantes bacterium]MDH5468825.1 PilZ domain-containing protein [Candidatus Aminicenantes bacterium]MDH5706951.1 PilZ domain-containing protein [Candidatus Aminicenantes bacterium]
MPESKKGLERRKYPRYECSLRSEVLEFEGKKSLIKKATVLDFSREGLKVGLDLLIPSPGSRLTLKILIPERQIVTLVSGEVVWSKYHKNRLKIGLKIKDADKKTKENILELLYDKWLEKKEKRRRKKELQKEKT